MSEHDPTTQLSRLRWLLIVAATLIALFISGLLLIKTISQGVTLAGCGTASGCNRVLSSRWSQVLGLPVSLFAVGVYALMLMMLWHVRPGRSSSKAVYHSARWLLIMSSISVVASVAWFVGLQAMLIGEWCRYCTASHAAGLVAAVLVLMSLRSSKSAIAFGLVGVAAVIALQLAMPFCGLEVNRMNPGQSTNFDIGQGENRLVGLLDGTLIFKPSDVPHLGELDAPIVMAEVMDYTCPHCKDLHEQLETLQTQRGMSFLIMILPTPLCSTCNANLSKTRHGHEDACKIARYMLELWFTDQGDFRKAHNAVMRSDAYTLGEVQAVVERTLGTSPRHAFSLTSQENAERIIYNNVELQKRLGPAMPQLIVGSILIRGRPYSVRELARVIDESQP